MPRPLAYGNGRMLVQADASLNLRDVFWPYVGQYNHGADGGIRFGVFYHGQMSWFDGGDWTFDLQYEDGTMVGDHCAHHAGWGVTLRVIDALDPVAPVFVRNVDWGDTPDPGCVFAAVDLRINESDIGDTVLYHPHAHGLVTFKYSSAVFVGGPTMDQWATGVRDAQGGAHAWQDAEDGHLSMRAIDQGSIDSVVRFSGSSVNIWIGCSESVDTVAGLMRGAVEEGEAAVVGRARARHLHDAPTGGPETDALYRQSLHIIRSQSDDRGAILAANDGDILLTNRATYSYMWPRDGALVARALDRAGHADLSRAWLEFSARLVTPDQPYWLHKYSPDGAFGATWHPWFLEGKAILPIQEDETSLTVFAFARHCLETKPEDEWVSRHIDALLHRPCQFMREYRDSATGLPLPSWDLWEERRGVHLYTLASMIAAFRAGAELERSRDTGDSGYDTTADELTQATLAHLVDSETGRFWRCLQNGEPDRTVDAATLSMGLLGALPFEHPSVVATQSAVEDRLRIRSSVDGVARYEHDYYFRKVDHHAGNPWIICTMWLAQAQIRQAKTAEELEACRFWFDWARRRANSTFVLSEQYHPETGEPLSVSPLTWSHAEVVRTCLDYRDQMRGLLA